MKQIPEEVIKACRNFYISNDVSLQYISENSIEICGTQIGIDAIKWYSRKERWPILRVHNGKSLNQVSANEKLAVVADKLYALLIDEENPLPAKDVASVARTWLDVYVKSNLKDTLTTSKTSAQQGKDLIAKLQAEQAQHGN